MKIHGWTILVLFMLSLSPSRADDPAAPVAKKPPRVIPVAPKAIVPAPVTTPAGQPDGPAPRIVCDAPQYDFGTVAEGEEVKHVFSVRNQGQGVLKILQARGG